MNRFFDIIGFTCCSLIFSFFQVSFDFSSNDSTLRTICGLVGGFIIFLLIDLIRLILNGDWKSKFWLLGGKYNEYKI